MTLVSGDYPGLNVETPTPALFDVIDVIDRFIWVSGTSDTDGEVDWDRH
jgi:hypothetical protein